MMLYIETVHLIKKHIEQSWPYLLMYVLLLLVHGYLFGSNDQMDFMPYARHLQEPNLYTGDFYIDCIGSQFNERWFLGHMISWIPHPVWPMAFLFIHFGTALVLLAGMKKWTSYYISSGWYQWVVILLTLILLYNRNLGGNELYYNMLTPSNLSKACGIWGLWFAFKCNRWRATILIAISTYLHPLAGAQVYLLSLFLYPKGYKLLPAFATLLLISPYLTSLYIHLNQSIEGSLFSDIMYVRNGHHFFPEKFGFTNYLILVPLFLVGTYYFRRIDNRVFRMLIVILLGCLIYWFTIYINPKYAIMSQWFKTTIWLKFFTVIALMHWLISSPIVARLSTKISPISFIYGLIAVFCALKITRNFNHEMNLYQLPWMLLSEEIVTARKAAMVSHQGDIFLVPPDYTAFKYFSERSTYVDWKAIPHNGTCLGQWWERISVVYGLSLNDRQGLNSIYLKADNHLASLTASDKIILKSMGISFLIFKPSMSTSYTIEKL